MKRTRKIVVWLNPKEYEDTLKKASSLGLDVSVFIRMLLVGSKVKIEDA